MDSPTAATTADHAEREALLLAVGAVLFNASNYPAPVQARLLGQDTRPLTEKVVDAVLAAREERRWATVSRGKRYVGSAGRVVRVVGAGAVLGLSHGEAWFSWADLDVVPTETAFHATPGHSWVDARPALPCGCGWRTP